MGYFDSVKKKDTPPPTSGVVVPLAPPGSATSYAAAALRREAEAVERAPEGTRNDTLNAAWFKMGRHVGAGNITAGDVRATLVEAARRAGLPDHEINIVLRDDPNSGIHRGAEHPRHPAPLPDATASVLTDDTEVAPDLTPDVEDAFWNARAELAHLRTYAQARLVSPWAVLGVALARVVTATPYTVCLPPIVGGRASLNMFVGLVGPSGSGKGAAEAVAAEALNVGFIQSHNVGSGEGIAHGYKRRVKQDLEWLDDEHAVLFSVPEIDSLAAQGGRQGATLMPQLRSGWTGEQLGFGYADPTKRIIVEGHQYRLCMVAGIQPARAACLLDDADGGTPQRFLWLPAVDHRAPDVEPQAPRPLDWSAPRVGDLVSVGGNYMDVCETARTVIIEARRARNRGDGDALDGHALLAQLKTAAALAILDGRYAVTDDDWNLADTVARKSAATRAVVVETLRAKLAASNAARADAEAARAVQVAETVTDAATKRVAGTVARKLRAAGDWIGYGKVREAVAGRDRQHFEAAVERLVDAGVIAIRDAAGNEVRHGSRGCEFKSKEAAK